MDISVKPGKYIVAVSGGVDSMVLLDMLCKLPDLHLVVAHFEHGIRADSDDDRQLVEHAALSRGLPFIYERGNLGPDTSEATARTARYAFLQYLRKKTGAVAIITAHHQDDMIETAIINVVRGTGRKGLSSLASSPTVLRPLLHVAKSDIYAYASETQLVWSEDSTNDSDDYLRNYIRHHATPKLSALQRETLVSHLARASEMNEHIDELLIESMHNIDDVTQLDRKWFVTLPHGVAREVMAAWLRQNSLREFDKKLIERLVVAAKVAIPGRVADINSGYLLKVSKAKLQITSGTPSSKQLNSV